MDLTSGLAGSQTSITAAQLSVSDGHPNADGKRTGRSFDTNHSDIHEVRQSYPIYQGPLPLTVMAAQNPEFHRPDSHAQHRREND